MHLKIYKNGGFDQLNIIFIVHFKDINVFRVAHSFGLGHRCGVVYSGGRGQGGILQ